MHRKEVRKYEKSQVNCIRLLECGGVTESTARLPHSSCAVRITLFLLWICTVCLQLYAQLAHAIKGFYNSVNGAKLAAVIAL